MSNYKNDEYGEQDSVKEAKTRLLDEDMQVSSTSTVAPQDDDKPLTVQINMCGKQFDAPQIALCCMNFFLNAGVSIIVPFYPPLAAERGLDFLTIGLVFGAHPIGSFLFSLVVAKFMEQWGRKNLMIFGLIVQATTIFMFGLLGVIENKTAFIICSLFSRFFQGISRSAYGATTFAYVPLLWPKKIQEKISIMESWTGLGLMMGPPLGSLMKLIFNGSYAVPFYVQAILFGIFIIPTIKLLPPDAKAQVDAQGKRKEGRTLPLGKVFCDRRVSLTFLLIIVGAAGLSWVNPSFAVHLGYYGVSDSYAALIMSTGTITYIISLNIVPRLTKWVDKSFVLSFGLLMGAIADEMMAPEKYLGLPNSWAMVLVGIMVCGLAQGLCILPFIPQLMEIILEIIPDAGHLAGDMAAGLFMGGYAGGQFFGPIVGGYIFDVLQNSQLPENCHNGKIEENCTRQQQMDADNFAFLNCGRVFAGSQILIFFLYLAFAGGYRSWAQVCTGKKRASSKKNLHGENLNDTLFEADKTQVIDPNLQKIGKNDPHLSNLLQSDVTVRDQYLSRSENEGEFNEDEDEYKLDDENRIRSSSAKGSLIM